MVLCLFTALRFNFVALNGGTSTVPFSSQFLLNLFAFWARKWSWKDVLLEAIYQAFKF